jgi:hypothetical protein
VARTPHSLSGIDDAKADVMVNFRDAETTCKALSENPTVYAVLSRMGRHSTHKYRGAELLPSTEPQEDSRLNMKIVAVSAVLFRPLQRWTMAYG